MKQFNKSTLALLVVLCVTSFSGMSAAMARPMAQRVGATVSKSLVPMGVRRMFTKDGETYVLASERSNHETAIKLKAALLSGEEVHLAQDGLANYLVDKDNPRGIYVPMTRMRMNVDGTMVYTKESPVALSDLGKVDPSRSNLVAKDRRSIQSGNTHNEAYYNPKYLDKDTDNWTATAIDTRWNPIDESNLTTLSDLRENAKREIKRMKARGSKLDQEFAKDPFGGTPPAPKTEALKPDQASSIEALKPGLRDDSLEEARKSLEKLKELHVKTLKARYETSKPKPESQSWREYFMGKPITPVK